jgi:hypothetical protein
VWRNSVCTQVGTNYVNELCGQNVGCVFFNIVPGDMYKNHRTVDVKLK